VPKGDHEIVLRYENSAFGAGAALSLASLLVVALLARPPSRP
jgi:uncharacterized membrane protein YfhO